MSPDIYDPIDEFYDQYSVLNSNLTVPSHMAAYVPDNQDDAACLAILTPEPSLGAKKWTINGKWITIGIYRDQGRTHPTINYYEDYIVFRLLPSFKLVTWAEIQQIFEDVAPVPYPVQRTMKEITTGTDVKIPRSITKSVNYTVPNTAALDTQTPLPRRFNQLYDEAGKPLKLSYDALGYPLDSTFKYSKNQNNPAKLNQALTDEGNDKVYAYDYWGLLINDNDRGPYYADDLITRDPNKIGYLNNIRRKTDLGGEVLFKGTIYDEFGNIAVGIQENNALAVRQHILPLALDPFNHPIKQPLSKRT